MYEVYAVLIFKMEHTLSSCPRRFGGVVAWIRI